jgi:Cu/Ag efflux pump CusA
VAAGYPGIRAAVHTYPDQLLQTADPETDDLFVRVYGDDFEVLADKAEEVREAMSAVDGVSSPRVEPTDQTPTLEIEVDLAAAERNGVKPGDVRRAAATLVQGLMVGNLFEEQKVFDVMVWGVPELRNSVSDIANLQVDKPGGGRVRLGDVADVRVAPNPSVLRHEATLRYVDVTAGISGRGRGAVTEDVRDRIQQIEFPLDHHAAVVSQPGANPTSATQVLWYGLAAAVVVFLLLQAAFASWRLTAVLFWVLPTAVVGGVVALALGRGAPTIGVVAGLLAVVAITTRWLVLHVRHIARIEQEEGGTRGAELAVRAAGERFGPVVITALAVAAAVLPLLFMGTVPGLEVVRPLAVTLLGGLVTATALILFVVPVLCARYGASHQDAGLESGGRQSEGETSHA